MEDSGKYYTYVLESIATGRFYIGSTGNLEDRLQRHNDGRSKSTKAYRPYQLIYSKEFLTRSEAVQYELALKKLKNRDALLKIMGR